MAQQESPKRSASRQGTGCLIIFLLGIGLFYGVVAYDRSSKAKSEAHRRAETEQQQAKWAAQNRQKHEIIERLAQKHHAVTGDWNKQAREGYTADLQKAMIRKDGQPIIFVSYLHDIVQKDDRYVLFFGPQEGVFSLTFRLSTSPMGYYVVECGMEHIDILWTDTHKKHLKEFAVAAVISSVGNPRFEVKAKGSVLVGDEVTIIPQTSETTFVATGACLELLPLSVQDSQ